MNDPQVKEFMSDCVAVLKPDTKLSEVRRQFVAGLFHHLPVVAEDGVLVGLVSTTDMLALSVESYGVDGMTMDAVVDAQFSLEEVMRTELVTLRPGETLSRAADLLSEAGFRSLPVVDDQGRLQGIVTTTDLIDLFRQRLHESNASTPEATDPGVSP